jgi:hypothetical protein
MPVGRVNSIQLLADASFSFDLVGTPVVCNTGGAGNNRRGFVVPGYAGITSEAAKAMLSTLEAAMLSGKRVKVYANDYTGSSYWGCQVGALDLYN